MESTKAKYKIGTRVEYQLKNHNIHLQYGIIKGSYDGLNTIYYTILKDDGTTSEVPEELIIEDYGYETFD
jgi:hypothetical protein